MTGSKETQGEPGSFLKILKGLPGQRSYNDCFSGSLGVDYEIICMCKLQGNITM